MAILWTLKWGFPRKLFHSILKNSWWCRRVLLFQSNSFKLGLHVNFYDILEQVRWQNKINNYPRFRGVSHNSFGFRGSREYFRKIFFFFWSIRVLRKTSLEISNSFMVLLQLVWFYIYKYKLICFSCLKYFTFWTFLLPLREVSHQLYPKISQSIFIGVIKGSINEITTIFTNEKGCQHTNKTPY